MGPRVEVTNAKQVRAALRRAGSDLEDLKRAHARAAAVVSPLASSSAPRRSGALAGTVRTSGTKTAAIIRAGYSSVPYAAPIHWGWPRRNIRPNRFIWDSALRTQSRWLGLYLAELKRIVANASKGRKS